MRTYKDIFENNPHPCFLFDSKGIVKYANGFAKGFLEDWNKGSDVLIEKNLKILLYQNNLNLQNLEILSNDKYYKFEVILLGDNEYCFYGSNVTFQKNTADTLFNLIDDVDEALFLVDIEGEGRFVEVNKTAMKYLGYTREELLTKKLCDIMVDFPLKTQADWSENSEKIKKTEGSITKVERFIRKDGSLFSVEMVISIKHLMEKDYQLTLARDITTRIEEEKEKEDFKLNMFSSAKLSHLGEMATNIAHEINNPLTIIISKILNLRKMMSSKKFNAEKSLKDLNTVETTVKRITKVISSLRNISKSLENNSYCNESFASIFTDVTNLYTERIKVLNMDFEILGDEEIENYLVYCNRSQLAQVLISIINNSCEALSNLENRWLSISLDFNHGRVEISVKDSGKSIAPTVVEHMFEPFYTTKSLGKGTGLGLAIAKSIVIQHNGLLEYDKSSRNTCFKITLPVQVRGNLC